MFQPLATPSPPGRRRSRVSDFAPVQSMRMSPGSSHAIASSAVTSPRTRSTESAAAAVDQRAERFLHGVERHEPARPLGQQGLQVRGDGTAVDETRLEVGRLEDRLDVLPVDEVGLVALDRVGNEVLSERDHPRPRVLAPPLVEPDRLPVDRLEQGGEEQADRPGTHDMDAAGGTHSPHHACEPPSIRPVGQPRPVAASYASPGRPVTQGIVDSAACAMSALPMATDALASVPSR